jgi:hypothetical protein
MPVGGPCASQRLILGRDVIGGQLCDHRAEKLARPRGRPNRIKYAETTARRRQRAHGVRGGIRVGRLAMTNTGAMRRSRRRSRQSAASPNLLLRRRYTDEFAKSWWAHASYAANAP